MTAALLSVDENPKIKLLPEIIQKQKDGIFDSDGQLNGTKDPFRIIYLYNYRNQFTVADENFKIIHQLKTIDTVNIAQIKIKKLSDGRHKMIAPPLKVNQNISTVKNLAFIHSALMGNNESVSSWKSAKVIDLYRLDKQEYVGSFYVYHEGDAKMTDYLATQQYFFTMIGNKLVRYLYQKPIQPYLKTGEAENLIPE